MRRAELFELTNVTPNAFANSARAAILDGRVPWHDRRSRRFGKAGFVCRLCESTAKEAICSRSSSRCQRRLKPGRFAPVETWTPHEAPSGWSTSLPLPLRR